MVTRILIARHGNTFTKEQTPTRIGRHTDLPLVEEERGRNLGKYIKAKNLLPTVIFAAPLKRTMQTAHLAREEMQINIELRQDNKFLEIDYGIDENKTEAEVELRLGKMQVLNNGESLANYTIEALQEKGQQIINDWNKKALVPAGWQVNPELCIQTWLDFAKMVEANYQNKTVMVVSSNGIIRFAPYITQDFNNFIATNNIKVATGNLCIFEKSAQDNHWNCTGWNIKPGICSNM